MTRTEYREREAIMLLLALRKITARMARFALQIIDKE